MGCCLMGLSVLSLPAQTEAQESAADTAGKASFQRMDIFPAISYSPETKLTLGVIGIRYFDFRGGDLRTPLSNMEFLAVYTTAKQIIIESRWEVFTSGSRWRTRGELFFNRYPDRNYGVGNEANVWVETQKEGKADTVNYLFFNSDRIKFSPVLLRKIRPNLYLGLQGDMEYLYRYEETTGQRFLSADSALIRNLPVAGLRSGIGLQLLYDTRPSVVNPLRGSFLELNSLHYRPWLGSDFNFNLYSVDGRKYLNPWLNHTLALRGVASFETTPDEVPMRALSRVGGYKFIRGYFKGTYQDHNMLAFETEYRLPFWKEGNDSKLWQVWRRLGIVTFLSGAQVFRNASDLSMDGFNLAAGGGLRVLFNKNSRSNLRIDYAVSLDPNSGGPGKRQSGLYFFLGEAF